MPTKEDLMQRQALPLRAKVLMSQNRIREWYNHFGGNVCISFSGGKDSTVLAHLVHEIYPDVPLVFADTGLEYPEIRKFAEKMGAEFVRPKMRFDEVISKYGYPLISKEVAEAIHFARRIVAKNPESLDSPEREREREREYSGSETERTAWRAGRYGTYQETDRRRGNLLDRHTHTHTHRICRAEQDGGERISQGTRHFHKHTDTKRKDLQGTRMLGTQGITERVQANHACQTMAYGEGLTGEGGGEKQLPG